MKKRNIIHSALSLSLTAALCLSMAACGGTQPLRTAAPLRQLPHSLLRYSPRRRNPPLRHCP